EDQRRSSQHQSSVLRRACRLCMSALYKTSGIIIALGAMMAPGSTSTHYCAAMRAPTLGERVNQASGLWIVRVSGALWASTEMGGEKGFNPAKQVKGRKRHLMTHNRGLPLGERRAAQAVCDADGHHCLALVLADAHQPATARSISYDHS